MSLILIFKKRTRLMVDQKLMVNYEFPKIPLNV